MRASQCTGRLWQVCVCVSQVKGQLLLLSAVVWSVNRVVWADLFEEHFNIQTSRRLSNWRVSNSYLWHFLRQGIRAFVARKQHFFNHKLICFFFSPWVQRDYPQTLTASSENKKGNKTVWKVDLMARKV